MELRLVLTVDDFDQALGFYRDALGLPELEKWETTGDARIAILAAGRATVELVNEAHAAAIDEIEVGSRVAGPVRIAFETADSAALAQRLVAAGAEQLAEPALTPWNDLNVRLRAPDGLQLTLFTVQ
jgi:catechol 2,3-dioxygenase-like lactoylglutathione lyase family enzyme